MPTGLLGPSGPRGFTGNDGATGFVGSTGIPGQIETLVLLVVLVQLDLKVMMETICWVMVLHLANIQV